MFWMVQQSDDKSDQHEITVGRKWKKIREEWRRVEIESDGVY